VTEKETPKKVTRRDFIRDAAVLGGAVTGAGVLAGCGPEAPPPPPEVIKETVEVEKVVEKEVPVEVIKEVIKEVPVELQQAIGYIERDLETCAGCRTCEAVCTLSHDGVVSPALARTWIVDYILEGRRIEGYTCKQCQGPECLYACPVEGALYIDEATGARVIDPEKCIGCKLCLEACPQYPNTPIRYDAQREICVKCDLCGGDPLCVKYCPESSLSFVKKEV
jgi:Fe-S-cluster-containing hydrogenase component 2